METINVKCEQCAHEMQIMAPSPDDDIAKTEGIVVQCDFCPAKFTVKENTDA